MQSNIEGLFRAASTAAAPFSTTEHRAPAFTSIRVTIFCEGKESSAYSKCLPASGGELFWSAEMAEDVVGIVLTRSSTMRNVERVNGFWSKSSQPISTTMERDGAKAEVPIRTMVLSWAHG